MQAQKRTRRFKVLRLLFAATVLVVFVCAGLIVLSVNGTGSRVVGLQSIPQIASIYERIEVGHARQDPVAQALFDKVEELGHRKNVPGISEYLPAKSLSSLGPADLELVTREVDGFGPFHDMLMRLLYSHPQDLFLDDERFGKRNVFRRRGIGQIGELFLLRVAANALQSDWDHSQLAFDDFLRLRDFVADEPFADAQMAVLEMDLSLKSVLETVYSHVAVASQFTDRIVCELTKRRANPKMSLRAEIEVADQLDLLAASMRIQKTNSYGPFAARLSKLEMCVMRVPAAYIVSSFKEDAIDTARLSERPYFEAEAKYLSLRTACGEKQWPDIDGFVGKTDSMGMILDEVVLVWKHEALLDAIVGGCKAETAYENAASDEEFVASFRKRLPVDVYSGRPLELEIKGQILFVHPNVHAMKGLVKEKGPAWTQVHVDELTWRSELR